MLTLFAVPKPFRGPFDRIQRNAIGSWTRLLPRCDLILFGDEDGVREAAGDFGARHVAQIERNEYGTPLLHGLFAAAERLARHSLLCYVNSDILLTRDFMPAVRCVASWTDHFLMVGQCWNLKLSQPLTFGPGWERHLLNRVRKQGGLRSIGGVDYFVFPRGLYPPLPPFAVGRVGFDNWLLWKANSLRAPVVDATLGVVSVHQDHDYSHVRGGWDWTRKGEEAKRNLSLAGGHLHVLTDATHWLDPSGSKVHRADRAGPPGRVPTHSPGWREAQIRLLLPLLVRSRSCESGS